MTNAIGTNGAFGGRTSVNAFNDVMGALSRGVLSGWACVPNSGLTVSLGGNGTVRDVAIAQDNAGNKTSINNISTSPVNVTIGAAPGANSRIDAIVAYVDNPPTGVATTTDNPGACGLIVVEGTAASSPVVPTESKIRTGITADGASGTTAYYVVLAYITMSSGTTDITANEIMSGELAQASVGIIDYTTIPSPIIKMDATHNGTVSLSANTRTQIGTTQITGLNPNWQYMVTVNIGDFTTTTGNVGQLDIASASDTLIPSGRIRCTDAQVTPSWSTLLTPSASSITFKIYAQTGGTSVYIEDIQYIFVPIRPAS